MSPNYPPFDEKILVRVHDLIEDPLMQNLSVRIKELEDMLTLLEARSFGYTNTTDVSSFRNCMLALWRYLLRYLDCLSVVKYQDVAFRAVRAILMRREFYLGNLGFSTSERSRDTEEIQTKEEKKVCRIYRKLLVETFQYAADILPHAATSLGVAENERTSIIRRFCTMVFAFAFLRIPAIQGPVIETLTWRLRNLQEVASQRIIVGGGNHDDDSSSSSSSSRAVLSVDMLPTVVQVCEGATEVALRMPKAKRSVDRHRRFMFDNPQLFAWPELALPDDATKAVPEDPTWLYSLGHDGLVFIDFFVQLKRQILEMVVCERAEIEWLAIPGYALFTELYTPLLQSALIMAVEKATAKQKMAQQRSDNDDAVATSSANKKTGQPSEFQVYQLMELGFPRDQAVHALVQTKLNVERAVEYLLTHDVATELSSLSIDVSEGSSSSSFKQQQQPPVSPPAEEVPDLIDLSEFDEFIPPPSQQQQPADDDDVSSRDPAGEPTEQQEAAASEGPKMVLAVNQQALDAFANAFDQHLPPITATRAAGSHDSLLTSFLPSDAMPALPPPALPTPPPPQTHQQMMMAQAMQLQAMQQQQQHMYPGGVQQQHMYPGGVQQQQMYPGGVQQQHMYPGGVQQQQMYGGVQQQQMYPGGVQQQHMYPGGVEQQQSGNMIVPPTTPFAQQQQLAQQHVPPMVGIQSLPPPAAAATTTLPAQQPVDHTKAATSTVGEGANTAAAAVVSGERAEVVVSQAKEKEEEEGTTTTTTTTPPADSEEGSEQQTNQEGSAEEETQAEEEATPLSQKELKEGWISAVQARNPFALSPTLMESVVVGSGVVLSNGTLLSLHVSSLLSAMTAFDDQTKTAAVPFVLEVMARWFHQSSTREHAHLGHIHVKIWVLSKSLDYRLVIQQLEDMLDSVLRRDAVEVAGGSATKALKSYISFLYQNVDLIHGQSRHLLLSTVVRKAFVRLFLNQSLEVRYGFHCFLVYKLLRFHRHHASCASDLELLTTVGSRLLNLDQTNIMEILQQVAHRKSKAANPWKDEQTWVEELDIDRAIQSQVEALLDGVRNSTASGGGDDLFASQLTKEMKAQIQPAIGNYARLLWDYYKAGLNAKNDIALSVFAPPLNYAFARIAFNASQGVTVKTSSTPSGGIKGFFQGWSIDENFGLEKATQPPQTSQPNATSTSVPPTAGPPPKQQYRDYPTT